MVFEVSGSVCSVASGLHTERPRRLLKTLDQEGRGGDSAEPRPSLRHLDHLARETPSYQF